ncbi:MAG: dTDP-4-dehydrorhamnose 3,5-epimerase [Elusimicrobia bacterium]|nr:dTDP-4-dehydrorhamnose 3,5-epimerase [Candidatus Obscuribacterium magneticum]
MKFIPSSLPGVTVMEPRLFKDDRGFFFEVFHARKYQKEGLHFVLVQLNHSRSQKGILRGLHYQLERPQAKLVRVLQGEIFDVAVDIRVGSPAFGRWEGVLLSSDNNKILHIPGGFAHGFCVLSAEAEVEYACNDFYDPKDERTLRWDDPQVKIEWPLKNPLLSPKDASAPTLRELEGQLPVYAAPRS